MKGNNSPTLAEFVKSKLNINATEYAELVGESGRTLRERWNSESGRKTIEDRVFREYVRRFDK